MASFYVFRVLVVGCKQVNLMVFTFIAQFHHIVGRGGQGPVIVANDTPIIIIQFLSANPHKPAILCLHLRPTFVKTDACGGLSPNARKLRRKLDFQP